MVLTGDWTKDVALIAAAGAAGVVNAIAGGGTLLTFPALTAVIPPGLANGTSTVALCPGSLASVWGYRREVASAGRWAALLSPSSFLGGLCGALMVTQYPEAFKSLVPWLILAATALFLVQPLVSRFAQTSHRPLPAWALVVFQFFVAVYGGYFGAGIGIIMLATLALMGLTDIHQMNGIKALQAVVINVTAAMIFIATQQVVWPLALVMMASSILGGYFGAHYGRRMNRTVVRWIVIAIGLGLSTYYFWQQLSIET